MCSNSYLCQTRIKLEAKSFTKLEGLVVKRKNETLENAFILRSWNGAIPN